MCTLPLCCGNPCFGRHFLPYGYGPDPTPMSNWSNGTSVEVTTSPGFPGNATVASSIYRGGADHLFLSGFDFGNGVDSRDTEFWPTAFGHDETVNPTVQGINWARLACSFDHENGTGFVFFGQLPNRPPHNGDALLYLPEGIVVAGGGINDDPTPVMDPTWVSVWFNHPTQTGADVVSMPNGPIEMTWANDPLTDDYTLTFRLGSFERQWNRPDASMFLGPVAIAAQQRRTGSPGPLPKRATITNFEWQVAGDDETLFQDGISFTPINDGTNTWTGGTSPSWNKTADTVLNPQCSSQELPRKRIEVTTDPIAVVQNQLYRIKLLLGPAALTGSTLTGPSLPSLIVDQKQVRAYTDGIGGSPQYQPTQVGYYYRPYYPEMTLGFIANPNTAGQILGVEIQQVAEAFAIQYPTFINFGGGGKNFTNWNLPLSQPITITPTIEGGQAPFEFEQVIAGVDHKGQPEGIPGTLNAADGEITRPAGFNGRISKRRLQIKATDALGRVAYSQRFRWQVI